MTSPRLGLSLAAASDYQGKWLKQGELHGVCRCLLCSEASLSLEFVYGHGACTLPSYPNINIKPEATSPNGDEYVGDKCMSRWYLYSDVFISVWEAVFVAGE